MVGAIALSSSQISQKSLMFMFGWVLAESGVGISILVRGGGNLKGQLDIIPSTTLFFKIKKKTCSFNYTYRYCLDVMVQVNTKLSYQYSTSCLDQKIPLFLRGHETKNI